MDDKKKEGRYSRIYKQLDELVLKSNSTTARMATIIAVLHHKMEYYFWTGFYLIENGEMTVNMYQGPVACQILEKNKGVCWAAFNKKETLLWKMFISFRGILPATHVPVLKLWFHLKTVMVKYSVFWISTVKKLPLYRNRCKMVGKNS